MLEKASLEEEKLDIIAGRLVRNMTNGLRQSRSLASDRALITRLCGA